MSAVLNFSGTTTLTRWYHDTVSSESGVWSMYNYSKESPEKSCFRSTIKTRSSWASAVDSFYWHVSLNVTPSFPRNRVSSEITYFARAGWPGRITSVLTNDNTWNCSSGNRFYFFGQFSRFWILPTDNYTTDVFVKRYWLASSDVAKWHQANMT